MIDRYSTVPVYLQLEQYISELISSGNLRPGDAVPSEHDLCQKFTVSRMTARKAVDYLVRQGKVERRRGQGTFVVPLKKNILVSLPLDRHLSSSEVTCGLDVPVNNRLICLFRQQATVEIADKLCIAPGSDVWFMKRLRLLGDVPFVFEQSWMITELFTDLHEDDLNTSKYAYISRKGFSVESSEKELRAELPSHEVRDMLGLKRDEPVLHATSLATLSGGKVFEFSHIYYNQQHYRFTLTAHTLKQ
ncbi:GntR family transcriptional regulator [Serratia aquatilis]|uniref:GntR family transcriptional regulator n=1 Tax=Serratia aquatilis TaxID=1737515 RepID=A0ABV6E7Y5_9GAMM